MSRIKSLVGWSAFWGGVGVPALPPQAFAQCEVAKLTRPEAGVVDSFGQGVSISGTAILVGIPQADASAVFRWDGSAWVFEANLVGSDTAGGDNFGRSVWVDGDVALIGAPYDEDAGAQTGSAYVFRRVGASWVEEQKLVASDRTMADLFGFSVAVAGDTAVVAASAADCGDGTPGCGAVYVYQFDGTAWTEVRKLAAPDGGLYDGFGWSAGLDGKVIVVGAAGADTEAGTDSGSAYVFRWDGTGWIQEQKLVASDAAGGDQYGISVSISGDYVVVGSPGDDGAGDFSGAAYVYWWNGTRWIEQQKLAPSDAEFQYQFGNAVALRGDEAVVGAWLSQAAYVFQRVGAGWWPRSQLTASDAPGPGGFGSSAAIGGGYAVVGAPNPVGPGAAYVYRVLGPPDCNANGIHDACEPDCNGNGIPDDCDIAAGTSDDCTGNGIPDECEPDCNGNTVPDSCDIAAGTSNDCNTNDIPDECDIASGRSDDGNGNGIPDECQTACCDPVTGACTDGDLTCREGLVPLGSGTDCNPSCCESPVFTGGDNCNEVVVHSITVPPVGDPPVTITITGDNSGATGPDSCGADFFEEYEERGWWEAFEIDQCAFVTVDLCCSDPRRSYPWYGITPECPCQTWISSHGVSPTVDPPPSACRNDDNTRMLFGPLRAGTYYYPVVSTPFEPLGQYQMHITVQACEPSACCFGSTCQEINELECADADGFFLGGVNEFWGFDRVSCGWTPDGPDDPCRTGTCCGPPGTCRDDDGAGSPMDQALCDQLGGTFTGGADCSVVPTLCPACAVLGAGNCQLPTARAAYMSDLTMPPHGVVAADDFIPQGDTLSQVCVWGVYLDPKGGTGPNPFDCAGTAVDEFHVRVYTDDNGLPAALIGESIVAGNLITAGLEPGTPFEARYGIVVQSYTLALAPPIIGLVPGERYWLEVVNSTFTPEGNTCRWHWMQHFPDNRDAYCVSGTGDPTGQGLASVYIQGSGRASDLAFCLAGPQGPLDFDPGPEQLGACCTCGEAGATCSRATLLACQSGIGGSWNRNDPTCAQPCSSPAGDDCLTEAIPISDGLFAFDTSCASRDGPARVNGGIPECCQIGADVWFAYTAPCTGTLYTSMCPTQSAITQDGPGLDGLIALYHDPNNPAVCPCPGDSPLLQFGYASDEDCNGIYDAGSGIIEQIVFSGECWLVRVGGFAGLLIPSKDTPGRGLLDVACVGEVCPFPPSPPQPEMIVNAAGAPAVSVKNRFLSFSAGEPGRMEAIRVKFVDLPPRFHLWEGASLWVGEPRAVSELSSLSDNTLPTFNAATLQCEPYFRDWSTLGTVHVYHEGIVAGGTYEIVTTDEECLPLVDLLLEPLELTTSRWGDVAGLFKPEEHLWTAPDGSVDVATDVISLLDKFSNLPGAPIKARADLEPATLDLTINITDVVAALGAFAGADYPLAPSASDPCAAG